MVHRQQDVSLTERSCGSYMSIGFHFGFLGQQVGRVSLTANDAPCFPYGCARVQYRWSPRLALRAT
jgi:hypothetical protein